MRSIALIALAGALALSACGKQEEEIAPTNELVEPPVENVIIEEPDAAPPAAVENVTPPAAPPPTVSELQQIQDDAAAAGMTARLPAPADEPGNGGE